MRQRATSLALTASSRNLFFVLAAIATGPAALCQQFRFSLQLDPSNSNYGATAVVARDFDHDGVLDFIAFELGYQISPSQLQVVRLLSGADGHQLSSYTRPTGVSWKIRDIAPASDVNGDGAPDVMVATDQALELRSGVDLTLIQPLLLAGTTKVVNLGDLNNDQIDDFGVHVSSPPGDMAISGATGQTLWFAPGAIGTSVGDLNNDGVPDALVANVYGWIAVSGTNAQLLRGFPVSANLNQRVAGIGDANLDGVPDVAISNYFVCQSGACTGTVTVFSGSSGLPLFSLTKPDPHSQFGSELAPAGDLDGSGRAGFIAGERGAPPPTLFLGVSGSGNEQFAISPPSVYGLIGGFDLEGDGLPEFAFGNYGPSGQDFHFEVYSLIRAEFSTFGTGCGGVGGPPAISSSSLPRQGEPFVLQASNLGAFQFGFVFTGFSNLTWGSTGIPLPADLTPIGMPGCLVLISPDVSDVIWSPTGSTSWGFTLPTSPHYYGASFFNQVLMLDASAPGGLALSNGGVAIIGS